MKKLIAFIIASTMLLSLGMTFAAAEPVSIIDKLGETGIYGEWYGIACDNYDFSLSCVDIFVTTSAMIIQNGDEAICLPYTVNEDGSYSLDVSGTELEGFTLTAAIAPATESTETKAGVMSSYLYTDIGNDTLLISVSKVDNSDPMAPKTVTTINTFAKYIKCEDYIEAIFNGNSYTLTNGAVMVFGDENAVSMNDGAVTGSYDVRDRDGQIEITFDWGSYVKYTLGDIFSDGSILLVRSEDGAEVLLTYIAE